MSENAPIFKRLLAVGSDPSDRTITVALGVDEIAGIRVDIDLSLVGPLMAAISAEAQKLNDGLSDEVRGQSSTLHAEAVWLSQDADNRPMIVFELANGSLLSLAMGRGDFAGLAAEMALLAKSPPVHLN